MAPSRYLRFSRPQWARLRADTPLTLFADELERLRGLNERVSMDEGSPTGPPRRCSRRSAEVLVGGPGHLWAAGLPFPGGAGSDAYTVKIE